ncbi:MAG TPA: alginate lyase family protein [Kofleriaceae bacterium]
MGEGGGSDYSGSDDEGDGDGSDDDNNSGGSDEEEEDADVLPTYPTQHPRIYVEAHRARLTAALAANTPEATRFRSAVDRYVNGEDIYEFRIWNAALMGALTGDPKYCAKAISAADAWVTAEEARIATGAQPLAAANSYLHVGDLVGDVMLTYDWCFGGLMVAQRARWLSYANQAVFNVWNPTQARWGTTPMTWSGWAVNDASNNYYYSFLRATMLTGLAAMGEDAQADAWITQFRDTKFLGQLVPTFDSQLRGGGSREGTAYGVSMRHLFHLYDLWHATTGEKLQAKTKHARQSMRTFMHQTMPTLDRFAPTGDQPRDMTATFFDYQRQYLQELIALYPTDSLAPRAKAMLDASTLPVMARAELYAYDFLYPNTGVTAQPLAGLGTSYYASGIGHVYSRSGWDTSATWVNLIGGAFTQSHAHQDQGSLMIYKDGWLAYDAVINSQNGIIQETSSHSLVRINNAAGPIKQAVGTTSQTVALHAGADWLHAAVDVTAAYKGNAAIGKVQREMVYLQPNVVVVYDRVATAPGTTQTWQLASPIAAAVSGATATISGAHSLKVERLAPVSATSAVTSLATVTGYRGGYRLDTTVAGGDVRYLHVLSIDGAAITATAANDSTVTVQLANGKAATIAFDRDNVGATLTYAGNTVALAAGVDVLPE